MADTRNLQRFPVPTVDDRVIYDFAICITGAQAAAVALDLGVFEFLEDEPAELDSIARRFDLAPRSARHAGRLRGPEADRAQR